MVTPRRPRRFRPELIGPTRVDHELVQEVLRRKALGIHDEFKTVDRKGRQVTVSLRSSANLYQRMMAAKGLPVQVGAQG